MIFMRKISQPLCSVITGLLILAGLLLPGTAQALGLSDVTPQLESIVQDGPQVTLDFALNENVRISGYEIERSLDPFSGFGVVLTAGRSDSKAIDQGVVEGQGYYYRIRAYKSGRSAGYSQYSAVVFADVTAQAGDTAPAEYTAPVLQSVQANGNDFVVSWAVPESAYGQPAGGFDVFTDGVDDNLNHTGNSTIVSGLQVGVEHCFQVEARWTQASPSVFPASNTLCAQIEDTADTTLPTVAISSPSTNASYSSDQTVVIVASAQDDSGVTKVEFYNGNTLIGTDTTNTFSVSWPVSEADNGQHSITAKAYDAAGHVATSSAVTLTVDIAATPSAPAEYTAPVLQSVQANGNDFVVSWAVPESAYGQPAGGFDVFTDGVDDNLNHTGNSTIVSGLQAGVEHCFQVEARWTQASPSVFPASNTLCAQAAAPADTLAPTVSITSPASGAQYTSEQTVTIVASAQDNIGVSKIEFYEGSVLKATDASTPYSYDWSITDVDKGSHSFTAKAYDVAGNVVTSSAVALTVDIQIAPAEYVAPVLESVEVSGSDFIVSWTLPETAYGQPAGGYDLFTDGVDDNLHHTGNSTIVSGLPSGDEHCFMLEARWTQADPSQFPASNVICAQAEDTTPTPETPVITGPVKVFPGAQGFGAVSIAGRGGQIIKVTNLNDSGSGSFRAAVQASNPRIIVFEVGGEINLKSQLLIRNPYMTIAGQTAPAPGITLTGTGLKVETHDLLFQHIFIRHTASDGTDAVDIRTGSYPLYNIVVDHVSVAWGDDENLSFNPGPDNNRDNNVTFSNNLIAEATGMNGGHNYGTLVAAGTRNFSAVGNLWMSHQERQPRFNGLVSGNLANNISYNIGSSSSTAVGSTHGKNFLAFASNLYIAGPNTPSFSAVAATSDIASGSEIYLSDNVSTGSMTNSRITSYLVNNSPVSLENIAVLSSDRVEEFVLANVGARPGERDGSINNGSGDPVDERLINEYRAGTGSLKTSTPSRPAIPSTSRTFQTPVNPNADDDGNGYTNIEEILYQMSLEVEGR